MFTLLGLLRVVDLAPALNLLKLVVPNF